MPRAALTDLSVKRIPVPEKGTVTHWDTMKGFGVRVSAGGSKTFIVLIGPGRRQSIGRYPLISLADARAEAKRILAEKTLGKVRPTHAAFEDVKEQFLAHCTRSNRPETVKSYRRHLNRHYPFGRKSVGDIGPRDILRNLAKLDDTPSEKHHAYVVGSRFFRWCIGQHFIDRSPMENLAVANTSRPRDRTFDRDELSELLSALRTDETPFKRLVLLLLLTGQRRGEISVLEWSWIDETGRTITFPASHTKNKRSHTIPLGSWALAVLYRIPRIANNPYVFPASKNRVKGKLATTFNGFSKAKAVFDKELNNVAPWVLHDMRRTFATGLQQLGVRLEVTERLLNHVSGSQAGVVGVYQRYHWMPEMREAIDLWEEHLASLPRR